MSSTVSVTVNNELLVEDDFWTEAASKSERVIVVDDEETKGNSGNVTDEGELEAEWLSEVGFGELSQQWRQGKSLPESDIGTVVQQLSLKPHQVDAVRKRIRTLNATLKRRKNQRRPPDVRTFFQNEVPENKDSSRSATPDSLDSSEYISSDYSPPRRAGSPSHGESSHGVSSELDDFLAPMSSQVPNFVSIFDHQQHSSSHVPGRSKDIFKPPIRLRGHSSNTTDGEIATDVISGIEMLNYHNVGTIYMKGYIPSASASAKKMSSVSIQGLPQPGTSGTIPHVYAPNQSHHVTTITHVSGNTTNIEINSRTYNASAPFVPSQKNGFTEELNKKNGTSSSNENLSEEDFLINEISFIDPTGQTLLSDLSEEDVKSVRSLLLMELTAQCDHLNIHIRRRKPQKPGKKSSLPEENGNGIFGVSLELLLSKDKRITGETNLEVPIVFEKLVTHLWKRSLGEEGLLRMAGHKGKINDLRATFESSLYSEPEQVDVAMNHCSSHDVANLLKQFLRELPIPLLGFEYIDTFFDVAGQLQERSQESCLRLLVLLLPQSHQAVLRMLLDFLRDLVRNSEVNKMSLKNVALILAPNLVPSSALRSQDKELSRAATWVRLTQTLIRYGSTLFVTPSDLLSQMRQINDSIRSKKAKGRQHGRSNSGNNGVNCRNGNGVCNNLTVSAPQLGFPEVMLPINAGTTAGDIVLFLLEEADRKAEYLEREGNLGAPTGATGVSGGPSTGPSSGPGNPNNNNNLNGGNRRRAGPRGQEINQNGPSLSCLLTQVNRDVALKTHSLYEMGGNIGYRRVDPSALIPAICRDNPGAAWVLRCNHRHSGSLLKNN